MPPFLAILDEMRRRPLAIYVGSISLSKLGDFLRGCEHAIHHLTERGDFLLSAFADWLYRHYGTTENISWEKLIRRHSANEEDAVNRFWTLVDQFLVECPEFGGDKDVTAANGAASASLPAERENVE